MTEGFQVARLIPVSGIANATEAEMRATSGLLSVLTVVRDFSIPLLGVVGAPTARRAKVEAFIETRFKLADGTVLRPDGVVQVSFGSTVWRALVEVKTNENALDPSQLNNYLTLAREQNFDAVLTVSNQIGTSGAHPCAEVKVRANSRVRLVHCSWTEILSVALRVKVHNGVADPEQSWLLGELIRYLEHPSSGAMGFDDMGPGWTAVRDAAREGTLRKGEDARDVVERWDQLVRFAALKLGVDVGADVQQVVPKAHADAASRQRALIESLVSTGSLDGNLRIPGAAGGIAVVADLRSRQVTVSADISAPSDRGNKARATWLLRQLGSETPTGLSIEAWPRHGRQPLVASLEQGRSDGNVLVDPDRRDTLRFRLIMRSDVGANRKDGGRTAGFAESVVGLVRRFYAEALQQITPWVPPTPRVRAEAEPIELREAPIADEVDLAEAIDAARSEVAEQVGPAAVVPTESTPVDLPLEEPENDFVVASVAMFGDLADSPKDESAPPVASDSSLPRPLIW